MIKLFVNTGGSIDDVSGAGGFTPSSSTFNTLTINPPFIPFSSSGNDRDGAFSFP